MDEVKRYDFSRGFREDMIESGKRLTRRQVIVLDLLAHNRELVQDGAYAFIGNQSTSPRTINALLRVCAIKSDSEDHGTTYYRITEVGRAIIDTAANLRTKGNERG